MNWLIIPHTGKKKLRGESNFLLYEDMAKFFLEQGDYVWFTVPEWTKDEEVHISSNKFFLEKVKYSGWFYIDIYLFNPELMWKFNRRLGSSLIDVVITSKPHIVPFLAAGLDGRPKTEMPVLYYEPGVLDKQERLQCRNKINAAAVLLAAAYSTSYPLFLSSNEIDIARRIVRRTMSGAALKRFDERARVTAVGIPEVEQVDKKGEFTVFFGARVNEVKNARGIVDLYDKFYSSGRKVKILVCTSTPNILTKRYLGKEGLFNRNVGIELYTDMDRESYMEVAQRGHVFVVMSRNEGFPVGFWEQIKMGLVGIFPDKKWATRLLPDDYPFIFKNIPEAYRMLCYVYDNYEKAYEMVIKSLGSRLAGWGRANVYEEIRGFGLQLKKDYESGLCGDIKRISKECQKTLGNAFFLDQLLEGISKKCRVFPVDSRRRMYYRYPCNYNFYVELTRDGYELDLSNGQVKFVRALHK